MHPDVFMFLSCLVHGNIVRPLLQLIMHDEDDAVLVILRTSWSKSESWQKETR